MPSSAGFCRQNQNHVDAAQQVSLNHAVSFKIHIHLGVIFEMDLRTAKPSWRSIDPNCHQVGRPTTLNTALCLQHDLAPKDNQQADLNGQA